MSTGAWIHDPLATDSTEDVLVERSADAVYIRLPRPTSWHQQLAVAWQLHQIGSMTLGQVRRVTLDVAALDDPPSPLMKVLSAFEQDLRRGGCELRIMGVRSEPTRNSDDRPLCVSCDPLQPPAASSQEPPDESRPVGSGGDPAIRETGREETKMSEKNGICDFEERLLDYVEMLYGVALKLTHNPWDAELVTRITMLKAWRWRNERDDKRSLKAELLKLLRQTFINQCPVTGLRGALRTSQMRSSAVSERAKAGSLRQEERRARKPELIAAL